MRTLVVGDIHGCYTELQRLLDLAGLGSGEPLIALGDAIDRGPASVDVIEFLRRAPDANWLMGNHERKHVQSFRGQTAAAISQRITRLQVGDDAYPDLVDYLDSLPRYFDLPEAVLVHAFFEPGVPLESQRETVIVGTLSGDAYLNRTYSRPWYELYDGAKPIVVGHHDYLGKGQPFVYGDRVFAIDTGCCTGGALTGLLLPEFRLLSVPSPRRYWAETRARFAPALGRAVDPLDLGWDQLEAVHTRPPRPAASAPGGHDPAAPMTAALERGEGALRRVEAHVMEEMHRVLAELCVRADYQTLPEREQGRLYAAAVGSSPVARLLHRARRGAFGAGDIRRVLRTPRAAMDVASKLGLERDPELRYDVDGASLGGPAEYERST